jgi:membrane-bound lytic murein transglycosylase MltF
MVARGETDVAVGFSITELRADEFWFGPPCQRVTQQLLYRARLEIMAGDSHVERLAELEQDQPNIIWIAHEDLSSDELIELLCQGGIDYTVANLNMTLLNKRLYPKLSIGFNLAPP